jgi:A/G-specific adenine glycosylase
VRYKNQFYVRKREHRDIWQNLYEFILIEQSKPFSIKQLLVSQNFKSIFKGTRFTINSASPVYKQQLTHQTINGQFINITVQTPLDINYYLLVSPEKLKELPFPKFVTTYLKD